MPLDSIWPPDSICTVCNVPFREHVYPEIVPCPDCGEIDEVRVWEAWGHPNGHLECGRCMDHPNQPPDDYHTFYKGEDGQTVIVWWTMETERYEGEWDTDEP